MHPSKVRYQGPGLAIDKEDKGTYTVQVVGF